MSESLRLQITGVINALLTRKSQPRSRGLVKAVEDVEERGPILWLRREHGPREIHEDLGDGAILGEFDDAREEPALSREVEDVDAVADDGAGAAIAVAGGFGWAETASLAIPAALFLVWIAVMVLHRLHALPSRRAVRGPSEERRVMIEGFAVEEPRGPQKLRHGSRVGRGSVDDENVLVS